MKKVPFRLPNECELYGVSSEEKERILKLIKDISNPDEFCSYEDVVLAKVGLVQDGKTEK